MRTIAIDFDGVLHSYTSGWQGAETISDPPVPGMAELCAKLMDMGYEVVVMSSRARDPKGAFAIYEWLGRHLFPRMRVTAEKVPAEVYIDDRGYRFDGNAKALLCFIVGGGMEPWNRGGQIHP